MLYKNRINHVWKRIFYCFHTRVKWLESPVNSITADTANTLPVSDYNPPSSSHHLYIKPWGPSESVLCTQFKKTVLLHSAVQCSGQWSAVQCCTLYTSVQFCIGGSAVRYTVVCTSVQWCPPNCVQSCALQFSNAWCSAVQHYVYSVIRYSAVL